MTDWIDDILADEPISNSQIAIVEGLLTSVPYSEEEKKDIERGLIYLTYIEAYQLINKLKEDYVPKDPREQFNKMAKRWQ
ncbi:MAG: hypothetical protein CMI60_00855 [Parvibaculum sp.]|nr:hypothetical protein [Parvibaculum sp.]|tara:strand:- start:143 stop:382 length:240 start_codon:yes stop_codon:yes gene_type:complete